jgi:hypothetical protein
MSLTSRLFGGSAMGFAHLASIVQPSGKAAKARSDDDKEDKDARGRADDDDDKDDKDKGGKARGRAEDDDEEKDKGGRADGGDDDDKEDKDARGRADDDDDDKSARGRADDDDEDEEKDDKESRRGKASTAEYRRGVKAERARCAAIFGAKAAAANVPLAASLAFETGMSADAAIRVLKGQPAPNSAGADRSRRNPDLGPDGAPQGSSSKKAWGVAIDKVTPNASRGGGGWGAALERTQR